MDTIRIKVGKASIQGLYPSNGCCGSNGVGGHGWRVIPFSPDTPGVYVLVCVCVWLEDSTTPCIHHDIRQKWQLTNASHMVTEIYSLSSSPFLFNVPTTNS